MGSLVGLATLGCCIFIILLLLGWVNISGRLVPPSGAGGYAQEGTAELWKMSGTGSVLYGERAPLLGAVGTGGVANSATVALTGAEQKVQPGGAALAADAASESHDPLD